METALIAPIPEAEAVVGHWRQAHDPSTAEGIPAHVTLLYPFVPAERFDDAVHVALARVFAGFSPFSISFSAVRRFPHVLWLAPDDPAPFVSLTHALAEAFPAYPPYGGAHAEVTPHLTIAQVTDAAEPAVEIDRIEAAFTMEAAPHLPVRSTASEAWLMAEQENGLWRKVRAFGFGNDG